MPEQQLIMEQDGKPLEARRSAASSIKTILLHILDDELYDQRIDSGLSLARACSAHLSCVHVTPIEAYVAFDKFGGVFVMKDVMNKIDQRDARTSAGTISRQPRASRRPCLDGPRLPIS